MLVHLNLAVQSDCEEEIYDQGGVDSLAHTSLVTQLHNHTRFKLGYQQHFDWKNDLYCSSTHYCYYSDRVGSLQYFYLHVSWEKNVLWLVEPEPEEHWCIGCVHYTCDGTVNKPKQGEQTCFCKDCLSFCIHHHSWKCYSKCRIWGVWNAK